MKRWALRIFRWSVLGGLTLTALGLTALLIAVYGWDYDLSKLDPARGGPVVITDRNGVILKTIPAADGRPGRAAWVPVDRLPAPAVLAVLVSEDAGFYDHSGVDVASLARAAWLDVRGGKLAYGGSTITMQLVRMVEHPGQERTFGRKIGEAVLAMRLERAMSKHDILEQYLNRAYYGHGAYGLEAAAQTYLGKPALALSLGEATLLALLPRAPTAYDPVLHLPALLARRERVLARLVDEGLLGADEMARALAQPVELRPARPPDLAPHFVEWVLGTLPAEVKARGGVVRTTLDLTLQSQVEARLREEVGLRGDQGLTQAGCVVLDTQRGEVLAMVGSLDSQINITTWRRHPGSALKPFIYALALADGDSPATIAYDIDEVPSAYHLGPGQEHEHGPVRYREALASSYNLAAVHVLEKVGIARLASLLQHAGVDLGDTMPADLGPRLALGSARVRLLDLAAGYGFMAREGRVRAPLGVLEVRLPGDRLWRPVDGGEHQLFSPQVAWLVADMLADPVARRGVFGRENPAELPFPAAIKTGTARGFSDTVAVGVTRELTVAAWAGRFDGQPTQGLRGMDAAAPIVRQGLLLGARGRQLGLPSMPAGIETVDVCAETGLLVDADCAHVKREHFVAGTAPTRAGQPDAPPQVAAWLERRRARSGR